MNHWFFVGIAERVGDRNVSRILSAIWNFKVWLVLNVIHQVVRAQVKRLSPGNICKVSLMPMITRDLGMLTVCFNMLSTMRFRLVFTFVGVRISRA